MRRPRQEKERCWTAGEPKCSSTNVKWQRGGGALTIWLPPNAILNRSIKLMSTHEITSPVKRALVNRGIMFVRGMPSSKLGNGDLALRQRTANSRRKQVQAAYQTVTRDGSEPENKGQASSGRSNRRSMPPRSLLANSRCAIRKAPSAQKLDGWTPKSRMVQGRASGNHCRATRSLSRVSSANRSAVPGSAGRAAKSAS